MSAVIAPTHTDWIQTFSGRQFFPLEPRVQDVCIEDIAHGLSNLCRYGGHTECFYSVAQHCLLVSRVVPREHALRGLLHDAAEAYLIDVPRPIKHSIGMEAYRAAESRLQSVVYQSFGLSPEDPACIKHADRQLLRTEQRDLMKPAPVAWEDNRAGALDMNIEPLLPRAAESAFLKRFYALTEGR
jgi:uncharacterized protein